ncbi:MAG: fibronectin type III domain-containing protein [Patescibacteria group bacterium]
MTNYAQNDYGNIPTGADELVIRYDTPMSHEVIEDEFPKGGPPAMLLYGDGSMLCGDPHATHNKSDNSSLWSIRTRKLNEKEIETLFNTVREKGFDRIRARTVPKDRIPAPVGAEPSVSLFTDRGKRSIELYSGERPNGFEDITKYLESECAKATKPFDSDTIYVQTVQQNKSGQDLEPVPDEFKAYLDKDKKSKTSKLLGDKAQEVKGKLSKEAKVYKGDDGKVVKIRTLPEVPEFTNGDRTITSAAESGKVYAQAQKKVRFLYVYPADQAQPADAQAKITDAANRIAAFYADRVKKPFITSEVKVVKGRLTEAQYKACPESYYTCSGTSNPDRTFFTYQHLAAEFAAYDSNTAILYSWHADGCTGWGGARNDTQDDTGEDPNKDFDEAPNVKLGIGVYSANSKCSQQLPLLAHEIGHGFTLSHTCDATLMGSCGHDKNYAAGLENVALNDNQAKVLNERSAWFNTGITAAVACPITNGVSIDSPKQYNNEKPGYRVLSSDGKVTNCGESITTYSDLAGKALSAPVAAISISAKNVGYYIALQNGKVSAHGDAKHYGDASSITLNKPIVGMASRSDYVDGKTGYWLVASDGGIFAYGAAKSYGSLGGKTLNSPIIGMEVTDTNSGYWLFASDGGVFAFGDARFYGSTGAIKLNQPIIGMQATVDSKGYWLVARDGGIFSFGNARYFGSAAATPSSATPYIDMVDNAGSDAYAIIQASGERKLFGRYIGLPAQTNQGVPPDFKTSMTYTDSWPKDYTPTNITASWTTAWPQERIPRDLQMNWYTASDGNGLPGSCVQIHESSEPPEHAWGDNHLCSNQDLGWSYTSAWPPEYPLAPKCVGLYEPGDPDTWGDNVLCTLIDVNLRWSYWGNISDTNTTCVSMNEAEDPHYWTDNFLCWDTYKPGSVSAPLPAGCINMNETSETAPWYDNVLCMSPDLGLTWSTAHPDPTNLPANCVRIYEPDDPDTWGDNVICTSNPNVHFDWSWRGNIYEDADTGCVKIEEPSDWDGGGYGWEDNYLCWNRYVETIKPLQPGCIYINETTDPHGWGDNVLCASPDVGLTFTSAWPTDKTVEYNCTNITEPADPYTWNDNVLCSNTYIGLHWSYAGNPDNEDTDCVLVFESSDPHSWGDNYLCWLVPIGITDPPPPTSQPDLIVVPDSITWTPASPQSGNLVTVSATVKNVGTASTPEGLVIAFSVDGTSAGWNGNAGWPLAPGESRTLASVDGPGGVSTWTATAGSHAVLAVVDPSNAIPNESNESNNSLSKTLTIAAPNTAPTVPANLRTTSVTSNSIALAWNASTDDKGVKEYRIYRNGNFYTYTTQLTYTDTAVASPNTYTYQVSAIDYDSAESDKSTPLSVTPPVPADTTPPTIPGNFNATAVSATQVNLSWSASTDNVGVTQYYVYRNSGGLPGLIATVNSPTTTYNNTGLTANTAYTFSVRAKDAAGNFSDFAVKTITTPQAPDTTAPSTPTLSGSAVSATQINLSWTASTDTGGSGLSGYEVWRNNVKIATVGLVTSYGDANGLAGGTTYSYYVKARDGAGNVSSNSNTVTLTTPQPAAALTTSQSPQGNWVGTYGKDGYVLFEWNAGDTDLISLPAGVTMTINGAQRHQWTMSSAETRALQSPDQTIRKSTAVYAGTQFDVKLNFSSAYSGNLHLYALDQDSIARRQTVTVNDGSGPRAASITSSFNQGVWINAPINVPAGGTLTITTQNNAGTSTNAVLAGLFLGDAGTVTPPPPPPTDTTRPSIPDNVSASAASPTLVNVNWTASTDNVVGVISYRVYRRLGTGTPTDILTNNITGTSFSDSAVTGGTTYSYAIEALDAAGNPSGLSSTATATTQAPPDTTRPSTPGSFAATALSATQAKLTWTASTDASGIKEYLIYRQTGTTGQFMNIATTTNLSYTDSVSASTTYYYYVIAKDNSSLLSDPTTTKTVATPAAPTTGGDTTPPTAPTKLIPTIISSNQVNLSWTAATDNIARYKIYRQVGTTGQFTELGTTNGPATIYGDATAKPNTRYSYYVIALDTNNRQGPASNTAVVASTNKK